MIIGVSGKIGSGKDTIGQIIQYLSMQKKYPDNEFNSLEDFLKDSAGENFYDSGWQIKKFADKLKDIVCMLIGCTREQLEDREFKEKELGEEWKVWHFYANDEKWSTVAKSSKEEWESELKVQTERQIDINQYLSKEKQNRFKFAIKPEILTPRKILQLLGTEAGRQIIHENIWVNSLMANYKDDGYYGEDTHPTQDNGKWISKFPNWIVTDMRFPNELKAVEDKGGITIRVERGVTNTLGNPHPSETALDDATFDYIIDNNGTIQELVKKVQEILTKENIL